MVATPDRGQLNREIKCPCKCIRGKYVHIYCCLLLFIYQVHFLFGEMCICARFTAVSASYIYIYITTTAVCVYRRMVITYIKGKDQPGKVANPARGQLAGQGK